jgi:uncharacterized protein YneF (UPF0154 family)
MLALLRVVLFEWILARIGLGWVITLLIAAPIAIVMLVGIPTLIVVGVAGFFLWRWLRKVLPKDAPPVNEVRPTA